MATSLTPALLGPNLHRAVFVLPRRVHGTDDAGDAPDVREPLRDAGAVLIRVVVAGENLPQTQIREEAAVLPLQAAVPVDDADVFVQAFPGPGQSPVHRVEVVHRVVHRIEHVAPDPDFGVGPDLSYDSGRPAHRPGQDRPAGRPGA